MVGPKGIVEHGNGAWGGTGGRCGREFDHAVHAKCTKKDTAKQEIPMSTMLAGGHARHKLGPIRPIKNTQRK